jgi:hypothetical protein
MERQWILDRPLEPVIGPAEGRTRWRAMTAENQLTVIASALLNATRRTYMKMVILEDFE